MYILLNNVICLEYQMKLLVHQTVLEPLLECPFGLLGVLIDRDVLNDEHGQSIRRPELVNQFVKQSRELLTIMIHSPESGKHTEFFNSLKETNQSHLANYISNKRGVEENECKNCFTSDIS